MTQWHTDPASFRVHRREERRRVARLVQQLSPRTWGDRYPSDARSDKGHVHRWRPRQWQQRYVRRPFSGPIKAAVYKSAGAAVHNPISPRREPHNQER